MDPYGSIHSQIYSILYLRTVLAMSLKQHIYLFKFSNADPYKSKWICKFSTSSNSSNVYTITTFCLNPISYTTHRKLSKICTYGSAFVNDPKSYQSIWVQSYLYSTIRNHLDPYSLYGCIWIQRDPYGFALVAPMLAPSFISPTIQGTSPNTREG